MSLEKSEFSIGDVVTVQGATGTLEGLNGIEHIVTGVKMGNLTCLRDKNDKMRFIPSKLIILKDKTNES